MGKEQIKEKNDMEYLDNITVENYKACLLKLFGRFIEFCEEYSIGYYCAGGTTIGAIRHHGFIPWDDDIDLFMMREDYNRLLTLKEELQKRGIGLEGIQCSDNSAIFLKIWDTHTALWELKEVPFVYGVFIDIFPLDYTDDTREEFIKKYKSRRRLCLYYRLSRINFSISSFISRIRQKDYKFVTKGLLSLFVPGWMSGKIKNRILEEDAKEQHAAGAFLASYYGSYWDREYYKAEWFNDYKLVDFESLKVRIPIGYHEYLTQTYRDYMKLPPKDKQVSHHYHYYLNLEKGMTIDEIRKELNTNKK